MLCFWRCSHMIVVKNVFLSLYFSYKILMSLKKIENVFLPNGDINLFWNAKGYKKVFDIFKMWFNQPIFCLIKSLLPIKPHQTRFFLYFIFFIFRKKFRLIMTQPKCVKLIIKVASLMKFDNQFVAFAPLTYTLFSRFLCYLFRRSSMWILYAITVTTRGTAILDI